MTHHKESLGNKDVDGCLKHASVQWACPGFAVKILGNVDLNSGLDNAYRVVGSWLCLASHPGLSVFIPLLCCVPQYMHNIEYTNSLTGTTRIAHMYKVEPVLKGWAVLGLGRIFPFFLFFFCIRLPPFFVPEITSKRPGSPCSFSAVCCPPDIALFCESEHPVERINPPTSCGK